MLRVVHCRMCIASVHRYPVKSMLGEELEQAQVTERGLLGDRAYALVDCQDGTVASAKHPRKWGALLGFSARFALEPRPGEAIPEVEVTLPDGSVRLSGETGTDEAISAVLGREVRLTSEVPAGSRFEERWPAIEGLAPQDFIDSTTTSHEGDEAVSAIDLGLLAPPGTFFDLAVLHVLSTSPCCTCSRPRRSTGWPRSAPGSSFHPRRYRPNVVVEQADDGFAEDSWVGRTVSLGEQVQADVSMMTMRCVMTTLGQGDLCEDRATLRTIAKHHRREIPGLGTWACAGVYAGVSASGVVRRGDRVVLAG